jgi:hypothetical protein
VWYHLRQLHKHWQQLRVDRQQFSDVHEYLVNFDLAENILVLRCRVDGAI